MKLRTALLATAVTAATVSVATVSYAQESAPRPPGMGSGAGNYSSAVYMDKLPARPEPIRHYLYVATPGDGGADGQSGFIVFDADHNYAFINRISYGLATSEMPAAKVTGIAASVPENKIYITQDGAMRAYDLKTDQLAWRFNGEPGVTIHYRGGAANGCCERPWTMPDGKSLIVASSYNDWAYVIDAHTGAMKDKLMMPATPVTHNLAVTPDGKTLIEGSISGPIQKLANISVVDIASKKVLHTITFSDNVRPLTINHDGSLVYANVNGLDGFEIGETATGKVLKRVELPGELWKAKWQNPNGHFFGHGLPSHGIGLTPDESEIWVVDAANDSWQVWDNSADGRNPVYNPSKEVKTTPNVAASWITMTNDGKTAFVADGTVIDVKAHKVIEVLKDEYGRPIHALEKDLVLALQDGKLLETNNQFAVGNPQAYQARIAAMGNGKKQASN